MYTWDGGKAALVDVHAILYVVFTMTDIMQTTKRGLIKLRGVCISWPWMLWRSTAHRTRVEW
jgi:hypothetical protein